MNADRHADADAHPPTRLADPSPLLPPPNLQSMPPMPDPDFTLKRNDTASRIQSTLENSGGTAITIQGATVLWKMCPISGGGTLTLVGSGTIDQVGDGSGTAGLMGQVHYNWPATSTSQAGLYAGEWEVTFSSGTVQTYPNGDAILVAITKDLPY